MVHTWSLAGIDIAQHHLLAGVYDAFIGCGVPLFLMISGALSLGKCDSFRTFYRKRYVRLLVPFLIWSFLIYILSFFVGKYEEVHNWGEALRCYVPFLMTNRINYAYWFVPLMALLYLLTPFLQRMLRECSPRAQGGLLLVGLVMLALRSVWPGIFLFGYTSALLFYLWMYLAGYYIYHFGQRYNSIRPKIMLPLFLVSTILYVTGVPADNLWRCLLCVSLYSLMLCLPGKIGESRWLRCVSDSSYAIYLFHMALISPLYKLVGFSGADAPLWQCILLPGIMAVVVCIVSSAICQLIKVIFPGHSYLGII